jgi:hypothetical protein
MRKSAISLVLACAAGLVFSAISVAREHAAKPAFRYIGGTMAMPDHCEGSLELGTEAMTFECSDSTVRIPYSAIHFMQYRTDISRKVRRMKPHWKVQPDTSMSSFGPKGNRFFTIVYREKDEARLNTLVLQVSPDDMRPYLAEIDLRAGQRVEVEFLDQLD